MAATKRMRIHSFMLQCVQRDNFTYGVWCVCAWNEIEEKHATRIAFSTVIYYDYNWILNC